jgi:hypothetical protein
LYMRNDAGSAPRTVSLAGEHALRPTTFYRAAGVTIGDPRAVRYGRQARSAQRREAERLRSGQALIGWRALQTSWRGVVFEEAGQCSWDFNWDIGVRSRRRIRAK